MNKSHSGFTRFRVKYTNNNERKADREMANKKNKRQNYERKNYDDLMEEMSEGRQNRKNSGDSWYRKPQKKQKADPPVVPAMATQICDLLMEQVCDYNDFINAGYDPSDEDDKREYIETKKSMERSLLSFSGGYHTVIEDVSVEEGDSFDVYALDRTIRFDKETHSLIRCSLIAVAMKDGAPAFYVNAYVNKDLIANIMVSPVSDKGTDFRSAARWDNRPKSSSAE